VGNRVPDAAEVIAGCFARPRSIKHPCWLQPRMEVLHCSDLMPELFSPHICTDSGHNPCFSAKLPVENM